MSSEISLASEEQVGVIKQWIGKSDCKFTLLYKASKDGWSYKAFHEKCDGKGPTLAIGRSSRGYICGGYTKIPWESSGGYKADPKAFIFSLCDSKKNREPFKLTQYQNFGCALYHRAQRGPTFGGGVDLSFNVEDKLGRSFLGYTYELPRQFIEKIDCLDFIAGYPKDWKLRECEIYLVE